MRFGEAIELARQGRAVARSGWNGKRMWVTASPGATLNLVEGERPWGEANRAYADHLTAWGERSLRVLPYLTMRTATGDLLPGWLASQSDMLSDDWMEVEPT